MPRKGRAAVEDEGPDKGWMESWADAMTLLMAFFVMLFAFALVDETKFYDFKVGMVTALGVSDPINERADSLLESGNGIALTVGMSTMPTEELRNQIEQAEEELEATGTVTPENAEEVRQLLESKYQQLGAAEFTMVGIDERGVFVRFDQRLLFKSGSAELGSDSDAVLLATNEVLQAIDNPVDVEGHTDDVPTTGRYPSNWELSSSRASAVVRWLLDRRQIAPRRFSAVGMADTRPVAPNSTEDGRGQNRRVEIVLRIDGMAESDVPIINPIIGDPGSIQVREPGRAAPTADQPAPGQSAPGRNVSETTNEEAPSGEEEG